MYSARKPRENPNWATEQLRSVRGVTIRWETAGSVYVELKPGALFRILSNAKVLLQNQCVAPMQAITCPSPFKSGLYSVALVDDHLPDADGASRFRAEHKLTRAPNALTAVELERLRADPHVFMVSATCSDAGKLRYSSCFGAVDEYVVSFKAASAGQETDIIGRVRAETDVDIATIGTGAYRNILARRVSREKLQALLNHREVASVRAHCEEGDPLD